MVRMSQQKVERIKSARMHLAAAQKIIAELETGTARVDNLLNSVYTDVTHARSDLFKAETFAQRELEPQQTV